MSSCATKVTIINSDSDVIRIGPDVKGHIYYYNNTTKQWELSKNIVQIPEGWYALPRK